MRVNDISDFPPEIQKQIARKLADQKAKPKYRNEPETVNGIRFDSRKEAKRYQELKTLLDAGEISDLRLQQNFTLMESYTKPNGERERGIIYKADFAYYKKDSQTGKLVCIVEDVKSSVTRTPTYLMKKKLMLEKFNIEIQEV